jgi:hypothetical protein
MVQEREKPWEVVFKPGKFPVEIRDTRNHGSTTAPPPKPLLLAFPNQSGDYPIVLCFHGFMIPNSSYTQILHHIASHGYITIAPQVYYIHRISIYSLGFRPFIFFIMCRCTFSPERTPNRK